MPVNALRMMVHARLCCHAERAQRYVHTCFGTAMTSGLDIGLMKKNHDAVLLTVRACRTCRVHCVR